MKFFKIIFIITLIVSSFIFGGYFGFNNGYKEKSSELQNCIEKFESNIIGLGMINHSINYTDDILEIILFNSSKCFYFDNVTIDCNLYNNNDVRLLTLKLNNTLNPQESGSIKLQNNDLFYYDSVEVFNINFKN